MLTTGADKLTGTVNSDTFTGSVGGNNDTLQSDDIIGGGAGTDTLDVTLANTPFAITPRSSSVEILKVRSQADGDDEGTNDVQGFVSSIKKDLNGDSTSASPSTITTAGDNTIDAQNMVGTSQFWNSNSRADLVIEDVRNKSHETTLGFQSTDPGDVDYAVFFDPSHITAPGGVASGATLTVRLADVLGLKVDTNGLKNLPYNGMTITVGTKDVTLPIDFAKLTSYADFVTAINAALVKAGLTTITATTGTAETAVFSTAVSGFAQGSVAGTFNPVILTNSGPEGITLKGYALNTGAQEPNGNLVRTFTINEQFTVTALTQVNMILDDVGRGSMAGDFLAGSMSTGTSGSKGIAQFNVSVDRSSHITTLQTTNNGLEVVNVKNIGANGNLRLDDNSLTDNDYGLTDVRVFDASTMKGKVTLSATLTSDVVAKYMDLTDTGTPSGDNSDPLPYRDVVDQEFSYDLGNGNDSLYLNISGANLAAAGTTTREDFVLTISGGTGDDTITTDITTVAPFGEGGADAWYNNSKLNANLSINGGEGNDTISTMGSGDWKITAGAGDDTVYSDNSGTKAVWVFNTVDQAAVPVVPRNLLDLTSSSNNSYNLYKGTLVMNFRGINSATVTIESTNYKTTDLQINQAIKQAIKNDPVLSKLLRATDGPANTLVVTSLTDGARVDGDLTLSVTKPTTLVAADVVAAAAAYGLPVGSNEAAVLGAMDDATMEAVDGDYAPRLANASAGTASVQVTDSTHNLGLGNDVLTLSTDNTSADAANLTKSNEKVVYDTVNFGNDTIVNFEANVAAVAPVAASVGYIYDTAAEGANIATAMAVVLAGYTATSAVSGANTIVTFTKNVVDATTGAAAKALADAALAPADFAAATAGTSVNGAVAVVGVTGDMLDFTALGGKSAGFGAALGTDGGINVVSLAAGVNDTAALVKGIVGDDLVANKGIYVVVNATNIGTVYQVIDGTAASDVTATVIGTIDLADTGWNTLIAANFA